MGYRGVILTYAKETTQHRTGTQPLMAKCLDDADPRSEMEMWERGALQTVALTDEGDFVALK